MPSPKVAVLIHKMQILDRFFFMHLCNLELEIRFEMDVK